MNIELILKRIKQYSLSKTINFALLLQMMAAVQVYSDDLGNPLFTMIVGIVVAYLRFKTTEGLHEK